MLCLTALTMCTPYNNTIVPPTPTTWSSLSCLCPSQLLESDDIIGEAIVCYFAPLQQHIHLVALQACNCTISVILLFVYGVTSITIYILHSALYPTAVKTTGQVIYVQRLHVHEAFRITVMFNPVIFFLICLFTLYHH